jgi:hypothetical protein
MRQLTLAIACTALIASTGAVAQGTDAAGQQPDLTREQARERADQLFDGFDLNHDGIVTRAEAERVGRKLMMHRAATGRDSAPGLGGHTLRFLKRRFADADQVTKADFEAAMLAHFDAMDSDHDGVLTAAEREQAK